MQQRGHVKAQDGHGVMMSHGWSVLMPQQRYSQYEKHGIQGLYGTVILKGCKIVFGLLGSVFCPSLSWYHLPCIATVWN